MNAEAFRDEFEQALQQLVAARYRSSNPLDGVIAYILAGSGKRIRAQFAGLAAAAVGGQPRQAMLAALAVEMLHAYSLVHDDLPCMDDDAVRRGRPTAHIKYNDGYALLAGDALQTDAFAVLADAEFSATLAAYDLPSATRLLLVKELAMAAGSAGMAAGQMLDLHWTARAGAQQADLDDIHILKTGKLIGAACAMGASAVSREPAADAALFRRFGVLVGHAFQVVDDLIDDGEGTGKTRGKDQSQGKLSYLKLMSRDEAQRLANGYTEDALTLLRDLGSAAQPLRELALGLLQRQK